MFGYLAGKLAIFCLDGWNQLQIRTHENLVILHKVSVEQLYPPTPVYFFLFKWKYEGGGGGASYTYDALV